MTRLETDVAIIGGGLGGVAAALAALSGEARISSPNLPTGSADS